LKKLKKRWEKAGRNRFFVVRFVERRGKVRNKNKLEKPGSNSKWVEECDRDLEPGTHEK
jgi:hypothetical protein